MAFYALDGDEVDGMPFAELRAYKALMFGPSQSTEDIEGADEG